MRHKVYNSQGVELGPNAYVLCQHCHRETDEVSRETPVAYAYHKKCCPRVFGYTDPKEVRDEPTRLSA